MRSRPRHNRRRAARRCGRSRRWCWWPGCGTRSRKPRRRACGCRSSALLLELGVLSGERRLLVLGDGAAWIRTWFEGLGIPSKAMILCWWHLRKRCYESMSSAGGPKDRRRAFEKELLGRLWRGEVEAAIELLRGTSEWVRNPTAVEELIAYLEKRRRVHPRLRATATSGFMDREHAGGEVQRLGGLGPLQAPGDELGAARSAGLGRAGSRAAQR